MTKILTADPFVRSLKEITADTVVRVKVGKIEIEGRFGGLKDQFLTVWVKLPVAGAGVSVDHGFEVSRETVISCLDSDKPITLK